MKFRWQQVGMGLMTISICFLAVGCTGSKLSQCANLIKVVNETVIDTKAITEAGTSGNLATIEKSVEIFEKAAQGMEGVSVTDEKLNVYKGQFLTMYKGVVEVNKQLVISLKERKLTKVNEGLRKYRDITSPERDLAMGLTQYCKEPEK